MAAVIHLPPSTGLAGSTNEADDFLLSPKYADFKHKGSRVPLKMGSTEMQGFAGDGILSAAFSENQINDFATAIKVCTKNKDLGRCAHIHNAILKKGLLEKCADGLVIMYAKCGDLRKAQALFDMHMTRNAFTWTALIAGYAREGQAQNALKCFEQMQRECIPPNAYTYASILKACATIGALGKGKEIHDRIARQGLLQTHIVLGAALVDMYAKCGALSIAQHVLEALPSRNVVSWSALIAGYAQDGQAEQALTCFEQMQSEGILPNAVTFTCILKACATIGALAKGKEIHDEIKRQGLLEENVALGGSLVDMYVKCGLLSMARHVFDGLASRNVVTWSALISGYVQEGEAEQALNCFEKMQHEGIFPNAVTYACILKACATIGAADKGKEIHDVIARQGLLCRDIVLGNALVDMYAKCGALSIAQRVFEELPYHNLVTWSTLIAGYAQEGQAEHVLNCFQQMQRKGILPDVVTSACVLNVCSHLGLIAESEEHFINMSTKYNVQPDLECYTCMVDLFGRAGHLAKAARTIQQMPSSAYLLVWLALLGACQKWGDVKLGRWAFEQAVKLDNRDGPAYILMANIYAAAGMQEKARKIEAMRIMNKVWIRQAEVCG